MSTDSLTNLARVWVEKHPDDKTLVDGLLARISELGIHVTAQDVRNRKDKSLVEALTDAILDHQIDTPSTPTAEQRWEALSLPQRVVLASKPEWVMSAWFQGKAGDIAGVDKPLGRPWHKSEKECLAYLDLQFGPSCRPLFVED